MHEPIRVDIRAQRLADHAIVGIDDIEYFLGHLPFPAFPHFGLRRPRSVRMRTLQAAWDTPDVPLFERFTRFSRFLPFVQFEVIAGERSSTTWRLDEGIRRAI